MNLIKMWAHLSKMALLGVCCMELDYGLIGARIRKRRKKLKRTQEWVAERADISTQHMSNIERATSIPSTEVIMRLAIVLETTPDEFLVGAVLHQGEDDESWRGVGDLLRGMDEKQLEMAKSFLLWLKEQK